ncbi:MAG: CFAP298 family protein [archaeon]|nr:CFAP298 family protein [archaeon]
MVKLHFKITEKNQFICEAPSTTEISDVIRLGVTINNYRCLIDSICMTMEDLMKFGPLKPEETRGLSQTEYIDDNLEEKYRAPRTPLPPKVGTRFNEDKTHHRTGWILDEDVTKKIMEEVIKAKEYISYKRAELRETTTVDQLKEHLALMKAGLMIGYPNYYGLGDWEPAKVYFEDKGDILNKDEANQDYYQFDTTLIWYAGKELEKGKLLCDYVGKNEKTKIIVKFTKKGTGAPMREPLIDKETHSKMLSYYYKRQEEHKKLEAESEDSYLDSQWADPKAMQKELYMKGSNISWKY